MHLNQVLALTLAVLATYAKATSPSTDDDIEDIPVTEEEVQIPQSILFKPTTRTALFLDQFVPETVSRWIPSESKKVVDGVEDEELLRYRGTWNIEEPTVLPGLRGDRGLTVKTAAAHHAISAAFAKPVDTNGKTFVAQYEVKLQNGLECGGAYMKLLTHDPSFEPAQFSDKSPYTIMFGPDKCGSTNKVHFIFRHQNPITHEFEEKHMSTVVPAKTDKLSNVYTLVVRPDQTFEVLINDESVKKGSLLEDFTPAVNPEKTIDDPKDFKPADWVEVAKIPDPEASKPSDWDESAPREIVNQDATMPEDWLVNEPLSIPDPESVKPEDWDDEEDGEWTAPTVDNPKCADVSGCGEWKKPMMPNPEFKGKWKAPMVDNPEYKGPWAARKIDNPNYFEDATPSNMGKIGAIGFELWTMQNGIQFDNIYIGDSETEAKSFRAETWAAKHRIESETDKKLAEKAAAEKPTNPDATYLERATEWITEFRMRVYKLVERVREGDAFEAILADPVACGACVLLAAYMLNGAWTILTTILGYVVPKKAAVAEEKKEKKE
ncbi:hypothetical protein HDU98_011008 [Podochytrium sp. JEL0797]|nr:hypothetical protein HDU98_011008 [Podochytrium sp. JEL0797]